MRGHYQPGTVLIVSSNPGGLIVARNALAGAGYRVITSGALNEGMRLVRELSPEVLLLDDLAAQTQNLREFRRRGPPEMRVILSVPKGRGAELVAATIAQQSWPMTQVVAVIEKPFDPGALLNAVRGESGAAATPAEPIEHEAETMETIRVQVPTATGLADRMESALSGHVAIGEAERAVLRRAAQQILGRDEPPFLSGRLGLLGVDQILQVAESAPVPVCCRFEQGSETIELFLKNRKVIFAKRIGADQRVTQAALPEEIEALAYEVMGWSDGRVSVVAENAPGAAQVSPVALSIQALLLEGMHRLDERRRSSAPPFAVA